MIMLETMFLVWAAMVVLFLSLIIFLPKINDKIVSFLFTFVMIITLLFLIRLAIWVIIWVKI